MGTSKRINLGRSWFLGIGINNYVHWSALNNAVRDVQAVKKLLVEEYDVEEDFCSLITNEQATEEGIMRELDRLVKEVRPEDKVLIYYSGHGHYLTDRGRGYWVPHDAKLDATSKYISNSIIRDYMVDIKSLHTFLITDACFSGSLFMEGATKGAHNVLEELEQKPSRWALCSGRHDEEVHDGPPGENSPFAREIIDILKQNQEDLLSVSVLINEVIARTRARYNQLPLGSPMAVKGHKWGAYVFRRNIDEDPFWRATVAGGTLADYSNYMQKFPQGKYIEEAEKAVEAIEERADWLQASQHHEEGDYRSFLTKFPEGKYRTPAQILLKSFSPEIALPKIELPDLDKLDLPEVPRWEKLRDLPETDRSPVDLPGRPARRKAAKKSAPERHRPRRSTGGAAKETEKLDQDFCVFLDAGHGGLDAAGNYVTAPAKMQTFSQGVFHQGGTFYEGVWNRSLLKELKNELDMAGIPNITLSHEIEDTSLSLRTKMANKYLRNFKNGLLISLHANASNDPDRRGLEIYHAGSPVGEMISEILLKEIRRQFKGSLFLGESDEQIIRQGKFYMLLTTRMPAIQVEHLFYSNYEDAKLLMQAKIVDGFARAHVAMIKAYRKNLQEA